MSGVNKNLVKELELVLRRDEQMVMTLERDDLLEKLKEQNM